MQAAGLILLHMASDSQAQAGEAAPMEDMLSWWPEKTVLSHLLNYDWPKEVT